MQGAPGSGKSTCAEELASASTRSALFASDEFWYLNGDDPEHYTFELARHSEAHDWNAARARLRMADSARSGQPDLLIIDSTNTRRVAVDRYLELAREFGYTVEVVRVDPGIEECLRRNALRAEDRRVPDAAVSASYASVEDLLDDSPLPTS